MVEEGFDMTDLAGRDRLPENDPMGNARWAVRRYGLDPALLDALEAAEREGDRNAFDRALAGVLMATLQARRDLG